MNFVQIKADLIRFSGCKIRHAPGASRRPFMQIQASGTLEQIIKALVFVESSGWRVDRAEPELLIFTPLSLGR